MRIYLAFGKNIFDFFTSLMLLILLLPIFLIFTLLLAFLFRGNPFFVQMRTGKHARIFKLIKFKTMNDKRDSNGKLLLDSERITSTGKFMRCTSLDELPQLLNILKGDMSLVGPRPLLPKYLPLYNDFQRRRHEVKPGITGWAQVNGRNALSWEEKFKLDVWYVDHVSFAVDLKILGMTIVKVFRREGIASKGSVSGVAFTGNKQTN